MRVGLVCPYSLDVPGGVQNHVLGLAEALVELGHHVSVLAPSADLTGRPPYVASSGRAVPIPYNGAVGRVSFGPVTAGRVGRWLREGSFDVVHVHEPLTPSISLLAVRAAAVPVVATFHTAQDRPRALAASAGMLRPWLSRIDEHLAVSHEAARTLRHYLPIQPTVVPNGLDVARFDGPGRRDGRTVLFLGRADEPRKGLPDLLAAWPGVLRVHPEARLLVAGPGHPPAPAPGMDLLGPVDEADKPELLRRADVLVAPNTFGESFGIVLTEAMAAGAAVVANGLPAFRAVLEEGRLGVLVTPGSGPGTLAGAVGDLLADGPRRTALAAAARCAVARYDWSQVAPLVLERYLDALRVRDARAG